MGVLLVGGRAIARQQFKVFTRGDQSANAALRAAGNDAAGVQHALRGGDGNVAKEGIADAVDGQQIERRRHGGIKEGIGSPFFRVVSEPT